ncbi:Uncharacterized protein TPAR_07305, partial [Tolypocladium paradoxum]
MLLYTKTATPKAPKRRSRAGCNYCKEKKKKCNEARPACSRCQEHGQDCRYEPVKPRVRRRPEPGSGLAGSPDASSEAAQAPSEAAAEEWHGGAGGGESPLEADDGGFDLDALDCRSAHDDVEEVVRRDDGFNLASPCLEFRQPAFYEFSQDTACRALMDHFCNSLSHLIVLREDEGNPFQQLVLPLSHNSQAVTGAIYALACAHLEVRGVEGRERSLYYHSQSVGGLARLLEQGDGVDKNELLAAVMLLVYYEVLVQRGRSNLVDGHLKGAMAIMGNDGTAETNPTTVFLERAFRFYDVIAALSLGTAPLSRCPSGGGFTPLAPLDSRGAASTHDSVDALLGMATSLWP